MKGRGVLADTCAWVDYFKPGKSGLKSALERALLNGQVYICGPVLYEITQGIKTDTEKAAVAEALGALEYVELSRELWIKGGEMSASLRKKGKTLPFSDVLIAALAIERGLQVLTSDGHFSEIPGLRVSVE